MKSTAKTKTLAAFINETDRDQVRVKLPSPKPAEYGVQLPERSQIAVEPPDGHELCVRREGEHVVVFTRRLPAK